MPIKKAKLNGKTVHLDKEKEIIRREILECLYCGAKGRTKLMPNKTDEYAFRCLKGQKHTGICKKYEDEKYIPVFAPLSPEALIDSLSRIPERRTGDSTKPSATSDQVKNTSTNNRIERIRSPKKVKSSGVFFEDPFDKVENDSEYTFLDYVIFAKWAKHIWQDKSNENIQIGSRFIEGRWLGSFDLKTDTIKKIRERLIEHGELWIKMFWKINGRIEQTVFCVDISNCYEDVVEKLFKRITLPNNIEDAFVPKDGPVLDVIVAGDCIRMSKEQCSNDNCPVCFQSMCCVCHGENYIRINSPNQIEPFPEDGITKRIEEDSDEKQD